MSLSQTLTYPCPRCQTANAYERHASIALDDGPVTQSVLKNMFNIYRCMSCGLQRRLESDLLVVDRTKDAYFQVIVRDDDVAACLNDFRQLAPGARLRVVSSRDALVEKVRLWVLGLDDVAYECVKFAMRINQRDLEGKLVLRFDRVQDDQLLFVSLNQDRPPDILPMPMHVYHRMASDLNTAAYASEPEVDERLARRLLAARQTPAPVAPQPEAALTWPQPGTVDELDLIDAVGWITLDAGPRIRFGGTSLQGFHAQNPGPGMRVKVLGASPNPKGVLKATAVQPLEPQQKPKPRSSPGEQLRRTLLWSEFVKGYPDWSDVELVAAPCRNPPARPVLPPHPMFDPWVAEIVANAPTCVNLAVYGSARTQPCEPTREDSFSHGHLAFLDQPTWPQCGLCNKPMEMCIQLAPAVMAQFVEGGRGLVALLCFACAAGDTSDPRRAHIRLVQGTHRVLGPESWQTASSLPPMPQSQRVTAFAPAAALPDSTWLTYRGEKIESASALLMGRELELIEAPEGLTTDDLAEPREVYDDWIKEADRVAGFSGARLGGAPHWDQYDRTPCCPHGEMLHLLEYDGGQFLDGALHVFLCRAQQCGLGYVAEF